MKTPRQTLLTRHQDAEARLQTIQPQALAHYARSASARSNRSPHGLIYFDFHKFWHEAILPWRRAWISMAVVWIGIIVINLANQESTPVAVADSQPPSPQILLALAEQRRLFAEALSSPSFISRPKAPAPRSDLRQEWFIG